MTSPAQQDAKKIRLGLCCLFLNEPITFRTTTAKALSGLPRTAQLEKLSGICGHNADSLLQALETVRRLGIGAFRIMSPLFPRMTHPDVGYSLDDLPDAPRIAAMLEECRLFASCHDIRLSFHPDQFVVLSSPRPEVLASSVGELEYHGWLAELLGVDVINLHAGGVYGDKVAALERFSEVFSDLSERVRSRLTLENDDVSYTPEDLLPVCKRLGIPLVYDVHHHRCNPDGLEVEQVTRLAAETWNGREQYCHISSPREGWVGRNAKPHADYINPADVPACWLDARMTVDVEAKAKELAVVRLMEELYTASEPTRRRVT